MGESDVPGMRPAPASPAPAPAARDPWNVQPPPHRPPWKRISLVWTGIIVVVLLVGLMAGFFLARSQSSGDSAAVVEANARVGELQSALSRSEDRNWTYYRTIEGLKGELEQANSTSTTFPGTGGTPDSFSDGVYLVGEDIPAGTYDGVINGPSATGRASRARTGPYRPSSRTPSPRGRSFSPSSPPTKPWSCAGSF